jgi:3-deoxy-D-manno-octulosonic-acid transferase
MIAARQMSRPWPLVYRGLTWATAPLVNRYLIRRCRRGKEDLSRLSERFGVAGAARPRGPLVWVHAASVGEAQSVRALAERVLAERAGIELLLTTGTVTSARLLADRLPPRARHQFVPIDVPRSVARFLDHWHPDLAIWIESELWPNLVLEARRRGIPMLLVNGRLSAGAAARWRLLPGLIRPIMRAFSLVLAQDAVQASRFRALGAERVASVGDLKTAALPLAADRAVLGALRGHIGPRPVWLAASTHAGEEETVAAAHVAVARDHPGLLTIIAPRHPARGPAIAAMLPARGLRAARRTAGEPITAESDIYVVDTLGELGVFFRLVDIVFIGGSLVANGGHNPFEAARLGAVVLHGPDMTNCAAMAQALDDAGAALLVRDAESLATAVSRLLGDRAECGARGKAAEQVAAGGEDVLAAVLAHLAPFLDRLAPIVPAMAGVAAPRCDAVEAAIDAVVGMDAHP